MQTRVSRICRVCILHSAFCIRSDRAAARLRHPIPTSSPSLSARARRRWIRDRANDEGSQRVVAAVFNSLMDWGDDLRVHPALAERLENPDPLTYVAHLRRGVRFHDGHELTVAGRRLHVQQHSSTRRSSRR